MHTTGQSARSPAISPRAMSSFPPRATRDIGSSPSTDQARGRHGATRTVAAPQPHLQGAAHPTPVETEGRDLRALLAANPELLALLTPERTSIVRAEPGKPLGLGVNRVHCSESVAAAIIEDRR